MPVRGFLGVDLSGNESEKVGSIPRRGRIVLVYDLRQGSGHQGQEGDEATKSGSFTLRGLYDTFPWSKGAAYDSPRFLIEDLEDIRLLLAELSNKIGGQVKMTFEARLLSGHYGIKERQGSFVPDALKELGLTGDTRAREMLNVALASSNGDVKRAWPLLKSMVKAACLYPPSSPFSDTPESDNLARERPQSS